MASSNTSQSKTNQTVIKDSSERSERKECVTWELPFIDDELLNSDIYSKDVIGNNSSHHILPRQSPPSVSELEHIRDAAEKEGAKQGKDQGYQDGFEEGLKQGYQEGYQKGEQQALSDGAEELKNKMDYLNGLITELAKPLTLLNDEIEQQLLSLVIAMVKSIVKHEINSHPNYIDSALKEGLKALPLQSKNVTIQLHSDDIELLESIYTQDEINKHCWQFEANNHLSRGDCIIQNQYSEVDLRLDEKLNKVLSHCINRYSQLTEEALSEQNHKNNCTDELTLSNNNSVQNTTIASEDNEDNDDNGSSQSGTEDLED